MLSRFPTLAGSVVSRLVQEAQGPPGLLELPRELAAHQQSSGDDLPPLLGLGRHLQIVFASRSRALPQPSREILLMGALETGGLPRASTYSTTDDAGGDHLACAERRAPANRPATSHLAFAHPLIRSAVVPIGERRAAHQLLAELMAAEPDARARHPAEATIKPDEAVAALIEAFAYRILRRGDAREAVVGLLRAAERSHWNLAGTQPGRGGVRRSRFSRCYRGRLGTPRPGPTD